MTRLDRKGLFVSTPSSTAPTTTNQPVYRLSVPAARLFNERNARVVINTDTTASERYMEPLLAIIKNDVKSIGFARLHTRSGEEVARGVFLMDEWGFVLVYIKNALVGYDGSGSALTRSIMKNLGIPESEFDRVNDSARLTSRNYVFVLNIL